MTQAPYEFDPLTSDRFKFTSVGKKKIEKVVDFIPIGFTLREVRWSVQDCTTEF